VHVGTTEIANNGENQAVAADLLGVIALDIVETDRLQGLRIAVSGPRVRVRAEQPGVAVVGEQSARITVLRGRNPLDRELPGLLELRRIETRPHQHIREQPQHERTVLRKETATRDDVLASRRGRELRADAFDSLGKLSSVPLACSLLQQIGKQRSGAFPAGRIADRAAADHGGDRHERRVVSLEQSDLRSIRERHALEGRQLDAARRGFGGGRR
jgi:hypothetical protein